MDEGKVLLVDLGRCDAETRRLLGSLIVTGLEQAARSRKNVEGYRKPFYFCIDEFQDFCANDGAAQTLAQILSECRKFGLHLTLAHQTLAQINERMKGALGNIQLKIVFGVSRQDAEILTRHLFQVDGERIKHIVHDPTQQDRSHPIFYTLQEEWEKMVQALQVLLPRSAYIGRPGQLGACRIQTISISYSRRSTETGVQIRQRLIRQVGVTINEIEKQIQGRLRGQQKNNIRPQIRVRTPKS